MRSLVDNAAMRLTVFVLSAFIGLAPAPSLAGSMLLLGTGVSGGGGSYTGPGDAVAGVQAFWSPARAVTAAFAATGNPIADIVDTATGTAACTIHIGSNGFADMTTAVCPTGSPTVSVTTFCTVTHSGGCSITKLYEQTGLGVGGAMTQATLSLMPILLLNFSNGLNA